MALAPAAAYSLRSFDADLDPNVVNVRRSSDNATSNFKASEVSDGTLTSWVNNVVTISPTLNNGGFEDGATGWTLGSATTIDSTVAHSGSKSAKLNVVGGGYTFLQKSPTPLDVGQEVTVGFWAKTNDVSKNLNVTLGVTNHAISFTTTDWEYKEITRVIYTNGNLLISRSGTGTYTIHIDDITVTNLTADGHVTTWYDQSSNTRNSTQMFASEQPKIVESGTLVSEGGLAGINFHTETSYLFLNHAAMNNQATLDSYYVTKATGGAYIYPAVLSGGSAYGMVAYIGSAGSISSNYGSPTYYANGTQITGTTRGDIYTATSGTQKLVVHQGANTTASQWGTSNMNFGNYSNNETYGYTGKLQEMIFFNTDQSANRTGIEKNINDTYTIY